MSFTIHHFSIQQCAQSNRLCISTKQGHRCSRFELSVHSHPYKWIVGCNFAYSPRPSLPIHLPIWVLVHFCVNFWVAVLLTGEFPTQSVSSYCQLVPNQKCIENLNRLVLSHLSNRIVLLPSMYLPQTMWEGMTKRLPANNQYSMWLWWLEVDAKGGCSNLKYLAKFPKLVTIQSTEATLFLWIVAHRLLH